jgi:hypothetical protein
MYLCVIPLRVKIIKDSKRILNVSSTIKYNPLLLQQLQFLRCRLPFQIPYPLKPAKEVVICNDPMTRNLGRIRISSQGTPNYTTRLVPPNKSGQTEEKGERDGLLAGADYLHVENS